MKSRPFLHNIAQHLGKVIFMEKINNVIEINELLFSENEGKVWRLVTDSIEKPLLMELLKYTRGNQLYAARILGINRNTLRTKLKKHGLLGRKLTCMTTRKQ